MAGSLQQQMEQLIENENRLMSVIDNMISGIVVLDRDDRIVPMNKAAEGILGLPMPARRSATSMTSLNNRSPSNNWSLTASIQGEHIRDEIVLYYPDGTDDRYPYHPA